MIFGLKGSSLLVRISNLVRSTPVENIETLNEPTHEKKGKRIRGKEIDLWAHLEKTFSNLADKVVKGIIDFAKDDPESADDL
jgi:hypothetical protein